MKKNMSIGTVVTFVLLMMTIILGLVFTTNIFFPIKDKEFLNYSYSNHSRNLSLEMLNFNILEQKQLFEILSEIDEDYFYYNQKIIFIRDDNKFCESKRNDNNSKSGCTGLNIGNGKELIIEWTNNLESSKITLCHELLHSYFWSRGKISEDAGHRIIDKLSRKGVCYEESND